MFCPEGDRWSYYRDATKPDSTPVPYRGADERRPRAQFDSEAAVQKALPDLVFADRGPCCGEVLAARAGVEMSSRGDAVASTPPVDSLLASTAWRRGRRLLGDACSPHAGAAMRHDRQRPARGFIQVGRLRPPLHCLALLEGRGVRRRAERVGVRPVRPRRAARALGSGPRRVGVLSSVTCDSRLLFMIHYRPHWRDAPRRGRGASYLNPPAGFSSRSPRSTTSPTRRGGSPSPSRGAGAPSPGSRAGARGSVRAPWTAS